MSSGAILRRKFSTHLKMLVLFFAQHCPLHMTIKRRAGETLQKCAGTLFHPDHFYLQGFGLSVGQLIQVIWGQVCSSQDQVKRWADLLQLYPWCPAARLLQQTPAVTYYTQALCHAAATFTGFLMSAIDTRGGGENPYSTVSQYFSIFILFEKNS